MIQQSHFWAYNQRNENNIEKTPVLSYLLQHFSQQSIYENNLSLQWTDLEGIMFGEISQKDKYYMIRITCGILKMSISWKQNFRGYLNLEVGKAGNWGDVVKGYKLADKIRSGELIHGIVILSTLL